MYRRITMLAALLIAGCGPDTNAASKDAAPLTPILGADATIFTIVLENHDYTEVVGSANAPYMNGLIAQYGLATNYKGTIHPSLGNYLHMISGANQYPGIIDLDPTTGPYFPADQPNLGTQLEAAGIRWRSYQESMVTPCKLVGEGRYAPKHDPFLYFTDIQTGPSGLCARTNVDLTQLAPDLATNDYRYMFITPNLDNDGHDPQFDPELGLRTSDTWMSVEVPKLLASEGFQNGGVLFITWDEAEGRSGDPDRIAMIVVSPKIKQAGMTSDEAVNHSSYLATVEDLLGLPRLATVKDTTNLLMFLDP